MENVDAILFEKNRKHFFQWCNRLEEFGYKNYYQVLNAKNYGIPQNRSRCFMVSILGDYYFEFPKPIKLELCVKDLLESEVAEKYYISAERVKELLNKDYNGEKCSLPNGNEILISNAIGSRDAISGGWEETCPTLAARDYKDPKVVCVPCLTPDRIEKRQNGRRFKENGDPMFTLTAQDIHGIAIRTNNEKGYDIAQDGDTINLEQPNSKTRRGRVGKQIAQTIMTSTEQAVVEKEITHNYRIRKLMPIECYKLQGFTREDFFKVKEAGISDSQCYKQAGNSIVVDVLEAIFRNMNIKGVDDWETYKKGVL